MAPHVAAELALLDPQEPFSFRNLVRQLSGVEQPIGNIQQSPSDRPWQANSDALPLTDLGKEERPLAVGQNA